MERRNDYRICQWNVWDPLPATAPMLPAPRPEQAPPREVADEDETGKTNADQTDPPEPAPKSTPGGSGPLKKRR
jgi:hypothetical protein